MKNFQQNLLMLLALALCALCAWQWYVQTLLHNEGAALQETIFKQAAQIQGYTNSIKNMDAEIAGLSTRVNELKQAAMTNEQAASEQKRENAVMTAALLDRLTHKAHIVSCNWGELPAQTKP